MRPPDAPTGMPLGLRLGRTAGTVRRAFDAALSEAGGSLPVWLVLISLKARPTANQRQIADAVGIRGATLTHHLAAMERAGLLTRRRDPDNRRVHVLELTDAGEELFGRLRTAAIGFDRRLRAGLSGEDVAALERLLGRLDQNVGERSRRGDEPDE